MVPHPPDPDGVIGWATAAAVAALLLGLAEIAVAAAGGVLPPPSVAFLAIFASVVATVVCGVSVGLFINVTGGPADRATLVGATLGPLAWVALGPPAWTTGGPLLVGAMGAIAASCGIGGVVIAREASERGHPLSSLWLWGGAAMLLAGAARLAATGSGLEVAVAFFLGLAVLGFCLRAAPKPMRSDRRLLGWLTVLVPAACYLPWLLPWLLIDERLPSLDRWPPNFVLVWLEVPEVQPGAPGEPIGTAELMATDAVRYRMHSTESPANQLLGLPNGNLIAPHLEARGYATASILPRPGSLVAGTQETDDRAAGRAQLATSASWMAGAPWLSRPASSLLGWVGHDRNERGPDQLGRAAGRWLLRWRALRAPAPFFLVVDLRAERANADAIDAGLRALLDRLDAIDLELRTAVVLVIESPAEAGGARVLFVPPPSWPPAARQPEPGHALQEGELGAALVRLADSKYDRPALLPGSVELQTKSP